MRRISSILCTAALFVLPAVAFFAVGLAVSGRYNLHFAVRPDPASAGTDDYVPRYRTVGGEQLVMVYVGASSCGWSNAPGVSKAVKALKRALAAHAQAEGMSFKAVGVALDWNPEVGVKHLRKFGLFDEISAGYNWGNSLAINDAWSVNNGRPRTPTVVAYRRRFTVPKPGGAMVYREEGRQVLGVASGRREIVRWAESEEVLPTTAVAGWAEREGEKNLN